MAFETNIEQEKMELVTSDQLCRLDGVCFARAICVHVMLARSRSENPGEKEVFVNSITLSEMLLSMDSLL